ncbi:MAG: stage II sporulation protein P [Clostridia bacterium]|nr:stage II sporulation protein P [Clostridia bacterium]
MKTSIVFSLKNFLYRLSILLLCIAIFAACNKWNLPSKLFSSMTKQLIAKKTELPFSKDTFSSLLFAKTVYAAMPVNVEKPAAAEVETATSPTPVATSAPEPVPASKDFSSPSNQSNNHNHGVVVKNHAEKSFNIEELLKKPLIFDNSTGGYKVLVVHTHTTESYFPNDRDNDENKNMIRVGKEFVNVLEKNHIQTLHITKVHDVPYTTSYKKSLESVNAALKEHPSIEVVIDLHRDALYDANGGKIKPLTTINGEAAAQVMIVTGTEKGGLPHPNWIDNLTFAVKVQNNLQQHYPNLARPVDLRKERFNTHTTKNSIIFEIGANGNTIEEAIAGAKLAAQAVANVLQSK